jgi:hypothetical protein
MTLRGRLANAAPRWLRADLALQGTAVRLAEIGCEGRPSCARRRTSQPGGRSRRRCRRTRGGSRRPPTSGAHHERPPPPWALLSARPRCAVPEPHVVADPRLPAAPEEHDQPHDVSGRHRRPGSLRWDHRRGYGTTSAPVQRLMLGLEVSNHASSPCAPAEYQLWVPRSSEVPPRTPRGDFKSRHPSSRPSPCRGGPLAVGDHTDVSGAPVDKQRAPRRVGAHGLEPAPGRPLPGPDSIWDRRWVDHLDVL